MAQQPPVRPLTGGPTMPVPPTLPQTITRDDQGHATVRAVRVTTPMRTDGKLDEAVYGSVEPASGFIQMEPNGGQPATEKTDVWVLFDNDNVYVSFRAWESQPDRTIANEMRRDSNNIRQGDSVEFAFDTFRDRRNAILFEANSLGARTDRQSTNERQFNADWNPVWKLTAGRFEGGWTIEAAVPFKSIRYAPGTVQDWGFQARRTNKWKNEIAYLTKVPPALGLGRADFSASLYANLVGIEAPPPSRNLEVKPYAIGDLTTDNVSTPHPPERSRRRRRRRREVQHHPEPHRRPHLQHRLRAGGSRRTAGEPHALQPVLSREARLLPGEPGHSSPSATTASRRRRGNTSDVPILFYSRRIGLSNNREVPILGGGRVTGRVGRYSLGFVNMQTREDDPPRLAEATNFTVVRVKRDILRRSSIGVLATDRSKAQTPGWLQPDVRRGRHVRLFQQPDVCDLLREDPDRGLSSDDMSYRAQVEYAGDRYGVQVERLTVDKTSIPRSASCADRTCARTTA